MGKRRYPRASAPVDVLDSRDENKAYKARDLSIGGVFVWAAQWPKNQQRHIVLRHNDIKVPASVRVAHRSDDGCGLAFTDSSEDFRAQVRGLLLDVVYASVIQHGDDAAEQEEQNERRKAPRFSTRLPVIWSYGNAQYRTRLNDLSMTGATLVAETAPEIGTRIVINLPTMSQKRGVLVVEQVHGCEAEVVRTTPGGFAVCFLRPSEDFKETVRKQALSAPPPPAKGKPKSA